VTENLCVGGSIPPSATRLNQTLTSLSNFPLNSRAGFKQVSSSFGIEFQQAP